MRVWLPLLAALALAALSSPASAQARLDCAAAPASICASDEVLALEGERLALAEQLTAADPAHAALAREQSWIDGLSACDDDVECYRTAYLNHNQTLRQSLEAPSVEPPLEEPPDADETAPPAAEREPPAAPARDPGAARGGQVYVPAGLPGWGFFTAIGVSLLIFWALLRRLERHKRELSADEARLRERWR